MRPLLWRRPMGEKLRHAYYLDTWHPQPDKTNRMYRSICGTTCTTLPPASDEPGGMECGECCAIVAAPALADPEALSPAIDLGLPYNDPPIARFRLGGNEEGRWFVQELVGSEWVTRCTCTRRETALDIVHRNNAAEPAGIYTAGPRGLLDIADAYGNWCGLTSADKPFIQRLIGALRDAAMEAECMGEMSGYRVTLLARHGLTDSSDPAFGPVKYPDQGPKSEPEPF